jgi:hypothetical protein
VYITSFDRDFDNFFEEKMAEKASGLTFDGTEVVTDIGRWIEKNDATWISGISQSYQSIVVIWWT